MFCYQCEQTAKGEGCTKIGVCGKEPEVAALQDLLTYGLIGLSQVGVEGRKVGISDRSTLGRYRRNPLALSQMEPASLW